MKKWLIALCCMLAATAQAAGKDEYRLGADDIVKITVYDHPDLSTEIQLSHDGAISFPLLGEIRLGSLTFTEAEQLIAKKLSSGGYIKSPGVNVLVTQYRSQRISILGEVSKPGRYTLDSAASLLDAIAMAGGISPSGGDRIVLVRGDKRSEILLPQAMANTDPAERNIRVGNGDIIYVPRLQPVYAYGEVNRPGSFRLEQNMSVMQLLSLAGGFNQRASHRNIQIHRLQADGSTQKISAKLTDTLQENDVVFVEESLF